MNFLKAQDINPDIIKDCLALVISCEKVSQTFDSVETPYSWEGRSTQDCFTPRDFDTRHVSIPKYLHGPRPEYINL